MSRTQTCINATRFKADAAMRAPHHSLAPTKDMKGTHAVGTAAFLLQHHRSNRERVGELHPLLCCAYAYRSICQHSTAHSRDVDFVLLAERRQVHFCPREIHASPTLELRAGQHSTTQCCAHACTTHVDLDFVKKASRFCPLTPVRPTTPTEGRHDLFCGALCSRRLACFHWSSSGCVLCSQQPCVVT